LSSPYYRSVEETFAGAGGALERGFQLDGKVREFWIQSAEGKGVFKKLELMSLLYQDVTAPKTLVGSDVVFSCDAILILRASDLPRRPLTGELIHFPRNTAWQIVESIEVRGFYQIALNRASSV
jgi:hypothetical protein